MCLLSNLSINFYDFFLGLIVIAGGNEIDYVIDKVFALYTYKVILSNTKQNYAIQGKGFSENILFLPWLPSWLDRGALFNVDTPGCGKSVVRGPTGHK